MNILEKIYTTICCVSKRKYRDPYNFSFKSGISYPQNQLQFSDNYIKTAKYTFYNFLFKAILLQYTRMANVYFLIIGILSSFPQISPVSSATIWFPIIIVLSLSVLRQGYEDYQRHKSDEQLNYEFKSLIFQQNSFKQIQWSSITVGSIIKVKQDQFIPADLILISSSDPTGNAFIQTSSLDGQKNLKVRKAYNQTNKYNCEQFLNNFEGEWQGTIPDKDMHKFSSKMFIQQTVISFQGQKQFLYRGARLKNTHWVYGLVIYTGVNTKIMMNLEEVKSKMSQIQIKVNYLLVYIMIFQIVLCLFGSISSTLFRNNHQIQYYYIDWSSKNLSYDGFLMFFSYFILMSTFIPISLVVSLEFVKVFQSFFINQDKLMYSQERKKGVNAKTVGLNEQLGQIQYVFTDKTGTLTKNIMQFKIAIIGQIQFGQIQTIAKKQRKQSKQLSLQQDMVSIQIKDSLIKKTQQTLKRNVIIWDKQLQKKLVLKTFYDLTNQYLKILSMAHEVLPQHLEDKSIVYRGASPDQIALVNFAKKCGYEFVDSNQSTTTVNIFNQITTYQVLQVFPFSPERKRMSIVIRQNGLIKMLVKGADNVIKHRLAKNQFFNLDQKVDQLSSNGLRTLLIAMRIISSKQMAQFKQEVNNLQVQGKDQAYQKLISNLQSELYLIGATAVLDRLQDQVPQTIKDLISASKKEYKIDIKVWMLTGDKLQTAQNIGKSCHLIHKDFKILKINEQDLPNLDQILNEYLAKVEEFSQMKIRKALIIEGMILTLIISNEVRQKLFLSILQQCEAVICCRLLPLQKAQILRIVKNKLKKICLAIGDGQNDVPMIRAANIGIGLFGEQGMGAVQASDYALPQFRMLRRLLFVHGRWNYMRISEMILYFFYKNIIFTIPRLIFAFYSGYSAQRVFDDTYVGLYNLLFTSIPLVVRAVFQQDLNYVFKKPIYHANDVIYTQIQQQTKNHVLMIPQTKYLPQQYYINKYYYKLFPKIYFVGQQNCIFNYKNFILWVIQALVFGTILTVIVFQVMPTISINEKGYSSDLWITSLALFTGLMMVVTLKLVTHTKFWPPLLIISIILFSLGFYIGYMWISNKIVILTDNMLGAPIMAWSSALTYFFVIFCCCSILFLDGVLITIDFHYGKYASKMRKAVVQEQQTNRKYLQQLSLKLTETDFNYMKLN